MKSVRLFSLFFFFLEMSTVLYRAATSSALIEGVSGLVDRVSICLLRVRFFWLFYSTIDSCSHFPFLPHINSSSIVSLLTAHGPKTLYVSPPVSCGRLLSGDIRGKCDPLVVGFILGFVLKVRVL